jgi:uncharacterized protein
MKRESLVQKKFADVLAAIKVHRRVLVAFSGGVDSTLLLAAAIEALGPQEVIAAIAVSPSLPPVELRQAHDLARQLGCTVQEVVTREMEDENYIANPPDRCYHCKRHLFGALTAMAEQHGITAVLEGSNRDDLSDYRPGRKSLVELGIRSPLLDAGLTKVEIRELLKARGLPVWDKPAMACLASRIPYGQRLTPERLARVDRAESSLKALGFAQVRVRDWGELAVVEVGPAERDRLFAAPMRDQVTQALKGAGYGRVALDPEGYRMGSLNAALPGQTGPA